MTINTDQSNEVTFAPEFYGMAQMLRAALPGARRVVASIEGSRSGGLDLIAFSLPDGRNSLLIFNRNERSFQVREKETRFAYEILGQSIVTFVW